MKLLTLLAIFSFFAFNSIDIHAGVIGSTTNKDAPVKLHEFPRICPSSDIYTVKINGQEADVYYATVASFVSFESNESVDVEITIKKDFERIRVLPLRLGIKPEIIGQTLIFSLPATEKAYIEIDLEEHLFIYGNALETDKPDLDSEGVRYFKSGQVYEVGELVLNEGETLYIEAGAVIRGQVRATRANNVKIMGYGVIDGGYFTKKDKPRTVLIEDSRNITIQDITIIEAPVWVLTLYYCDGININNINEISYGYSTDGIDVVNSSNVKIRNCMLKNDDDVIVIKSFKNVYRKYSDIIQNTHLNGVHNVLVEGCALQTNRGGHVFEIGHELVDDSITNIRYIDCDVLGAHDHGGVFGIHNADAAHISNIRYENIRVDHYYSKLIDIRILKTRYSSQEEPGTAQNIYFKDIHITVSNVNPGYSLSFIAGFDEDHLIKNVIFENFRLNGEKVLNPDQLELFTKYVKNIEFK